MASYENIVILTGAGISAESGLSTFRDKGGIWSKVNLEEVATPEGFQANPQKVYDFYNERRGVGSQSKSNAAHIALAQLEKDYPGDVTIITQNIDTLHEQAGGQNIIHMHGRLDEMKCNHCGGTEIWGADDLSGETRCISCGKTGYMRPNVVWFGEMPYQMNEINKLLSDCYLFAAIGTSGEVYPAAGFVAMARDAGAHTVELNLEKSRGARQFHQTITGKATKIVPEFVNQLLA